eukprot:PhF_6_TR38952/c0_g1_i1/m.58288/K18764/CCRN4L; nocturnin
MSWSDSSFVTNENTVFVSRLPIHLFSSLEDLKHVLKTFCKVHSLRILTFPTGEPKNCGFITFARHDDFQKFYSRGEITIKQHPCPLSAPKAQLTNSESKLPPTFSGDDSPLVKRQVVQLAPLHTPTPSSEAETFSVMTWNTLFTEFTNSHEEYCPKEYLEWKHRMPRILDAISLYSPDLIALQEVGAPTSADFAPFYSQFEALGYKIHTASKYTNSVNKDGVCLAYRTSVFGLENEKSVVAFQLLTGSAQSGLVCALRHLKCGRLLIVGTGHLKAAKLEEEGRIRQCTSLLNVMSTVVPPEQDFPVSAILMGDLNTEPRWELCTKMKQGELSDVFGQFQEVYSDHASVAFTDKQYTCMMQHTQDQLDYIFHTPSLAPMSLLKVPGDRDIVSVSKRDLFGHALSKVPHMEHLPTPSYPSDHLCLWC